MRQRAGYTLVELVVGAGLASLLMGGLASALFLASSSLPTTAAALPSASRAAHALAQLADDVRHAQRVLKFSANAAVWQAPDRNGDGQPETVQYAWSGRAGDPLRYQINDLAPVDLVAHVHSFRLGAYSRTLPGETLFVPDVTYLSHEESKTSNESTSTRIARPAGVIPGDLLLIAVVIDGSPGSSVSSNVKWTEIANVTGPSDAVTLLVGWRIAAANEPAEYSLSWKSTQKHYAWVVRFTGHDVANPIGPIARNSGASLQPPSPNVVPDVPNSRIVRFGGFDETYASSLRVDGHELINFGGAPGSGGVLGASAHAIRHEPAAGGGNYVFRPFSWTSRYCAVTVALRPRLTP